MKKVIEYLKGGGISLFCDCEWTRLKIKFDLFLPFWLIILIILIYVGIQSI